MNVINSQRILKNTLYLYFRMLFLMIISLYTSRVVFITLGVNDYGIYNLVGGVVTLFSFFDTALSNSSMRFLSHELGQKNHTQVKKIFNMSVNVHIFIAILIFILAETIGHWFFKTKLNIPNERIISAQWVYQFSIINFLFIIIKVPFHALIITHENMSFYAFLSLFEGLAKLAAATILQYLKIDKLLLHGLLLLSITFIVLTIYILFCFFKFKDYRYTFLWDWKLFKKLISFSGWATFEGVADVSSNQGAIILLNIFHGVTLNAVMGIATRVGSVVNEFVTNFQKAFKPQILKSYNNTKDEEFFNLVVRTSKLSFYLLLVMSLPIILNAEKVLKLWLGDIPFYTIQFTQLMLIFSLIESISGPLWMVIYATGKIKTYQIINSSLIFSNLLISAIFLWIGWVPTSILFVKIGISIICLIFRLIFLKTQIAFNVSLFLKQVLINLIIATFSSILIGYFIIYLFLPFNFILKTILIFVTTLFSVYYFGLTKLEKYFIINLIREKFKFLNKRNG